MSMISSLCDKLRAMAETVGLAMPQAATLMMEAADTIWELRNKCSNLVDERETAERNRTRNAREYARLCHENDALRELVWDLYCLAYPSAVEWEVSDAAYDKYSPCKRCKELHGGKSPCASATKDMTEECCAPIQAVIVADRMRELGIEVDE